MINDLKWLFFMTVLIISGTWVILYIEDLIH
jgi:hypothetical protein